MSQLTDFVKKRSINNVALGRVVGLPKNPMLIDVKLADLKTVTLPTAQLVTLRPGDVVEVVRPQGTNRVEYVSGPAAVIVGGDPLNRVVGVGQG
jgi:hypothetical protein